MNDPISYLADYALRNLIKMSDLIDSCMIQSYKDTGRYNPNMMQWLVDIERNIARKPL